MKFLKRLGVFIVVMVFLPGMLMICAYNFFLGAVRGSLGFTINGKTLLRFNLTEDEEKWPEEEK